ncbi:hypothetical protein SK128_013897, partial [Halocaridina rubra]
MTYRGRCRPPRYLTLILIVTALTCLWLGRVLLQGNSHTSTLAIFGNIYEDNATQEESKDYEELEIDSEDLSEGEEEETEDFEDEENTEDYEEDYSEEEDDDLTRIEAAMLEEEDREMEYDQAKLQDNNFEELPQEGESPKVVRSVTYKVDYSILLGNKNFAEETSQVNRRFELRKQTMEKRCLTVDTSRELFNIVKTNKFGIFFKQKASTCLVNK